MESDSVGPGESQSPFRGFEQIAALVAGLDPIALGSQAIDGTRRVVELTLSTLENFASTVDNLNRTTTRINSLLDDIEEPLKRVMPQVGSAINAMATLGETATALGDLAKRLSPLAALADNAGGLFGFRPQSKTQTSTPPAEPPTSA